VVQPRGVVFPLSDVHLHTAFLDTKLRAFGDPFSYFQVAFQFTQYRVPDRFLFDHQYPERSI
jgi:hypothetical protein